MKIILCLQAKKLPDGSPNAKTYPLEYSKTLIELLKTNEYRLVQIGDLTDVQLPTDNCIFNTSFEKFKSEILSADLVVAVDTYAQHLAWYCNKPCVCIFSKSNPEIFGHKENVNIFKDAKYFRPKQFDYWKTESYDIASFIEPIKVYQIIKSYLEAIKNGTKEQFMGKYKSQLGLE